MKFRNNFWCILLIAFVCCGCASYHWLLRPGATGRLVDSQSEAPVAGALVVLSKDPELYGTWHIGDGRGLRAVTTLTMADGTFSLPSLQKQGVIDTASPNDGVFYLLSVSRDGYKPYTNKFWYPSGDYPSGRYAGAPVVGASTNFGEIHLERLSR